MADEATPIEVFRIPCVELEDSSFHSVSEAIQACTRSGCGDNKRHCGYPDVERYTFSGLVRRKDSR